MSGARVAFIGGALALLGGGLWLFNSSTGRDPGPPVRDPAVRPASARPPPRVTPAAARAPAGLSGSRPPTVSDAQNSAAGAIAGLARAWSTGRGWADAVGDDGLQVALAGETPRRVGLSALSDARMNPPPWPTPGCPSADLNLAVGEPFLTAYFAPGASLGPWVSDRDEWSTFDCHGIDAGAGAAVRVCTTRRQGGIKVVAIEAGLSRRPSAGQRIESEAMAVAPAPARSPEHDFYNVVLVPVDEHLAARAQPRSDAPVVHRFAATARGIPGRGPARTVDENVWVPLESPAGPVWVDRRFLARTRTPEQMRSDSRYTMAIDEAWSAFVHGASPKIAQRGFFIEHFGTRIRVGIDDWSATIKKQRRLDGAACEDCMEGSLQEIVGDALTDALRDANSRWSYGEIRKGANSSWALPASLSGFNVLSVFDPLDSSCTELDWKTAIFFFDEEDGVPKLAGLAFDSWSP